MKVLFACAPFFTGPQRHIFRIVQIYHTLGKIFQKSGIDVSYFVRDPSLLPNQKCVTEDKVNDILESFDVLFIWNGSHCKTLVDRCRAIGIPVYFSELGWMPQNGTFYFDLKGVNFNSSITDWAYYPLNRDQQLFVSEKIHFYHSLMGSKNDAGTPPEKDFVFAPFQMEQDSQILKHSPRIKTMQAFVDYVCGFVPGNIIFKTHPKAPPSNIHIPDRCRLVSGGSTNDYLSRAQYVVTINSTVGVEALTYYKPVINLGNAFYQGRQITYSADTDEKFVQAIEWASKGEVAKGVIEAFLCFLFLKQWYSEDLKNTSKALGLIEDLVCG